MENKAKKSSDLFTVFENHINSLNNIASEASYVYIF